ncbi:cyclic-phosphate processing receiver domain-containing protein [Novipirellula artificiosorum]|nr:cyclic-phosphate processing receiver domain-containing protein [Novipirellula artificiosorum]
MIAGQGIGEGECKNSQFGSVSSMRSIRAVGGSGDELEWQDGIKHNCLRMRVMKVYLDDERQTPDGWVRVYWPDEAIELLKTGAVTDISLDHDLGDDKRGTGYDVVLWIEEQVALHGFVPPTMMVHSANVSARTKMENGIRAIEAMVRRRDG